jgi:hypothetical protein
VLVVNPVDMLQIFFSTVMAALEQRDFIRKIIPYSFYLIGAPSMLILSLYFDLKIKGLWIGLFLSIINIVVQSILKLKEISINDLLKFVDNKIHDQENLFEMEL